MPFFLRSHACLAALVGAMLAVAPIVAAQAAQQLIATPYPETLGGSANLGGGAAPRSSHQHLIADPVPQSLGPTALGNPHSVGHHARQRLIRTPYWRQFHQFPRY
jgi:hypothetical protein